MTIHKKLMTSLPSIALALGAVSFADAPAQAQQILDEELIVRPSLCVGEDCNNDETFGTDTIRLKEENLRIDFDDTGGGTFPENDWRIVINDDVDGGASHFSIADDTADTLPFRIEAGAPSNALVVKADGDIGMGTVNPANGMKLHLQNGDYPTIRLHQDGSEGWPEYTWDIAGNEVNFIIRNNRTRNPFWIHADAVYNALFIDANSNVGIGAARYPSITFAADAALHIQRGGDGDLGLPRILYDNTDTYDAEAEPPEDPVTWYTDVNDNAEFRIGQGTDNNALLITSDGKFGMGTESPEAALHVGRTGNAGPAHLLRLTNDGNPQIILENTKNSNEWEIGAGQNYVIEHLTTGTIVMTVSKTGDVIIPGSIMTGGGTCGTGCDRVFEDGFELLSIEEHAELMWKNKHLPNVGPTVENKPINLSDKVGRMLNELEKAHIYIEQLHARVAELEKSAAN
ncbi:MAG: hypothetical protein AB3N20_03535 [Rhizobiaceae bacterium]